MAPNRSYGRLGYRGSVVAIMVACCFFAATGIATADGSGKSKSPEYMNVEQILDIVVANITARYNLNEEQTARTDELMKREVNKFLNEHHDEAWPVIRSLMRGQAIGEPPEDPDELKRLAKSIAPLTRAAEVAIRHGNDVWREWLSDEQKALHDHDLKMMDRQFAGVYENIESWETGKPLRRNIFPPAEKLPGEPSLPSRPAPGIPSNKKPDLPAQVGLITTNADMFATYVEEFIKDYELDSGQVSSARSILKEYQGRAQAYLNSKRVELEKANTQQEAAIKKRDSKAIKAAEETRRQMLEPVNEYFVQMDERLHALLTAAQKDKAATKQKSKKGPSKSTASETKNSTPKKSASPKKPRPKKKN